MMKDAKEKYNTPMAKEENIMITMLGNRICKDCVAAMEVIDRERLPITFHDMSTVIDYLKEFLTVRSQNPEVFKEAKENNGIGIPVFILDDGTVTMDCEAAFEAARKVKVPAVTMYGSHVCKACRAHLETIKAEGLKVEFHDIVENLNDMRAFLKIREGNEELYADVIAEGRVGIPVYILPDGTITRDSEKALDAARAL
jgi:glutaredoxin-related protein